MNPLLELCMAIDAEGKKIQAATFDSIYHPTLVTLHLDDDSTRELPLSVDHETFMDWWKDTARAHHRKQETRK